MSREAFEAWIKRDSTLSVERDGEGYRDMDVYLMWRAWQAAQADAQAAAQAAAWAAARDAAWAAARDAQKTMFIRMCNGTAPWQI